jgi:hypothetical protein
MAQVFFIGSRLRGSKERRQLQRINKGPYAKDLGIKLLDYPAVVHWLYDETPADLREFLGLQLAWIDECTMAITLDRLPRIPDSDEYFQTVEEFAAFIQAKIEKYLEEN